MRVVHVVPAVTEEASGPSYSVTRLCESLLETNTDVRLASLEWQRRTNGSPFAETFPVGVGPRRLGVSPAMRRWLFREAAGGADLIHNHGLWMMPNVYAGTACRRHGRCRLVVSPRGMLSRWALRRNAFQKRVFWKLVQGPALRSAACFHATAHEEYVSIREAGFDHPVCMLPNGIDVPPLERALHPERRRLLFVGRIHPKKGVDILLRAWRAVESRFADWDLVVAGPDNNGYLGMMQSLAADLRLRRVTFAGALYGERKLQAYREADVFVLATHSENFGLTVAEALAAGTPAIVSTGAPWRGLDDHGAGWSIAVGVDPLVACLERALFAERSLLAAMGRSGREWMLRDFCWRQIASRLAETYRWVVGGGVRPEWVQAQ